MPEKSIEGSKKTILVLDNLRSTYNVGSIFRTADAFAVDALHLCGTTPAPTDRFGRKNERIAKVALGAEETVSWKQWGTTEECVASLKSEGWKMVVIEQTENTQSLEAFERKKDENIALIFGAEVDGVSPEVVRAADQAVEIPMRGMKESLNVSVAVGIVLWKIS